MFVRGALRGDPEEDGIAPVIDGFNLQEGFITNIAAIIACPLTERAFSPSLFGINIPFKHNLCMGRNGKTCHLTLDDWVGFSS
jgi:hypothetical protein